MAGWSCGLKTAQTSCVSGIPDGVQFHVGESVDGALTCFCAEELCNEELCNEEHFCDGCVAGTTTEVPPPTTTAAPGAADRLSSALSIALGVVTALVLNIL